MTTNTNKRTLLGAAKLLLSTTAIIGIALSSSAAFALVTIPDIVIPNPQPSILPFPGPHPVIDPTGYIEPVGNEDPIPNPQPIIWPFPGPHPVIDPTGYIEPVGNEDPIDPPNPVPPPVVAAAPSVDQSVVFENFLTYAGSADGLRVIYTTIGNSQNLANISPAAGGNSAEALAGISPAAGGNDNAVERTESSSSDSCWAEGASRSAAAFGANITTNFDDCQ